jgi:hypothetical protein
MTGPAAAFVARPDAVLPRLEERADQLDAIGAPRSGQDVPDSSAGAAPRRPRD